MYFLDPPRGLGFEGLRQNPPRPQRNVAVLGKPESVRLVFIVLQVRIKDTYAVKSSLGAACPRRTEFICGVHEGKRNPVAWTLQSTSLLGFHPVGCVHRPPCNLNRHLHPHLCPISIPRSDQPKQTGKEAYTYMHICTYVYICTNMCIVFFESPGLVASDKLPAGRIHHTAGLPPATQTLWSVQQVEPLISGFKSSYGVRYRTLRWTYFLQLPIELLVGFAALWLTTRDRLLLSTNLYIAMNNRTDVFLMLEPKA